MVFIFGLCSITLAMALLNSRVKIVHLKDQLEFVKKQRDDAEARANKYFWKSLSANAKLETKETK